MPAKLVLLPLAANAASLMPAFCPRLKPYVPVVVSASAEEQVTSLKAKTTKGIVNEIPRVSLMRSPSLSYKEEHREKILLMYFPGCSGATTHETDGKYGLLSGWPRRRILAAGVWRPKVRCEPSGYGGFGMRTFSLNFEVYIKCIGLLIIGSWPPSNDIAMSGGSGGMTSHPR